MKKKKLEQVVTKIFSGAPLYSISKLSRNQSGIPVINIKDILDNQIQIDNLVRFDYKNFRNAENYMVFSGDVLVTCRGTQLKVAVVPQNLERAIISSNLIAIRLGKELHPLYLATYLRSEEGQRELLKRTASSISTLMLSIADLEKIEIPVPPLSLQEKIVNLANTSEEYYRLTVESANLSKSITAQVMQNMLNKEDFHGKINE